MTPVDRLTRVFYRLIADRLPITAGDVRAAIADIEKIESPRVIVRDDPWLEASTLARLTLNGAPDEALVAAVEHAMRYGRLRTVVREVAREARED